MIPYYEKKESELQIFRTNNMTFPAHLHSQIELLYVEDGSLEVTVGAVSLCLQQGDFAAIFPNCVHSYHTQEPEGCNVILAILNTRLVGEFAGVLQKYHPKDPVIRKGELHPDIPYAMNRLLEERQPGTALISAYLQLILARVMPAFEMEKNSDSGCFDVTYRVINYISQNFNQPLSLDSIARELGVGKYHLSRIFSNKLQTSFTDYLGSIRVNYAQGLLRSTDDPITKITFDSGFESQRTFNRMFRELTGTSPGKYRSQALPLHGSFVGVVAEVPSDDPTAGKNPDGI